MAMLKFKCFFNILINKLVYFILLKTTNVSAAIEQSICLTLLKYWGIYYFLRSNEFKLNSWNPGDFWSLKFEITNRNRIFLYFLIPLGKPILHKK